MGYKEKDLSKLANPVAYVARESKAMTERRFNRLIGSDAELDMNLSCLLMLFATPLPTFARRR